MQHVFGAKAEMMSPKLKKFLQSWVINTLAVLVAVYIVPGIHFRDDTMFDRVLTPFMVSLVLGIFNSFIRPFLMLLALPLLIFTLGLFMFVINGLLLYSVGLLLRGHFIVDGFWSAFWGALIISIVSVILNTMTGTGDSHVEIRRGPRPPSDGGGPVIDV